MLRLNWRLRNLSYNEDNFHRIAIDNLEITENKFRRYWEDKFKTPTKPYDEHTEEEIYIKMLEDYYSNNPVEISRFKNSFEEEWDGEFDEEYEKEMQEKAKKIGHHVDLKQFQADDDEGIDDNYEFLGTE